ncbi:MAG: hypothetical protein IKA82_01865 [Clostridia bacterium]|nr:hypothetical protein [Clostridia bacterium]
MLNSDQLLHYETLRISEGGVVSNNDTTSSSNQKPTLIVGLGGMGMDALYQIKTALHRRLGGKINKNFIKFLEFDTDTNAYRNQGYYKVLAENTEAVMLDGNVIPKRQDAWTSEMRNISTRTFSPTLSGDGAGQKRLSGRFVLFDNAIFNRVISALRTALSTLSNAGTGKEIEVYLITGTGGGTGSGLCVDIPYLIRHVAYKELHIPENALKINGFVFLPDTYNSIASTVTRELTHPNGYAALKEIDYFMAASITDAEFKAQYNRSYNVEFIGQNIFDICFLVGGTPSSHASIPNSKEVAVNVVKDTIINFVVGTQKASGGTNNPGDSFLMSSFIINTDAGINAQVGNCNHIPLNGVYKYVSLGSGSVNLPVVSIHEYVVSEVFGSLINYASGRKQGLKHDDAINKLLTLSEGITLLTFDSIISSRLSAYKQAIESEVVPQSFEVADVISGSTALRTPSSDGVLAGVLNRFKGDDEKALLASVKSQIDTLISNIDKFFADPSFGPYCFEAIRQELINRIKESIDGLYRKSEELKRDNPYTTEANEIESKVKNAIFKKNALRDRLDDYKSAIIDEFTHKAQIQLIDTLKSIFDNVNSGVTFASIKEILEYRYGDFVQVINKINEVMADNAVELKKEVFGEAESEVSGFESNLLRLPSEKFERLRNHVEDVVNSTIKQFKDNNPESNVAMLLHDLVNAYLSAYDGKEPWTLAPGNNNAAPKFIEKFRGFMSAYEGFGSLAGANIATYLSQAYANVSEGDRQGVYSEIIARLKINSSPMFTRLDETILDLKVNYPEHNYLVLPECINAFEEMQKSILDVAGDIKSNSATSNVDDSFYLINSYFGLPLWNFSLLQQYEMSYNAKLDSGVDDIHRDMGEDTYPRLSDYPALILPDFWRRFNVDGVNYKNKYEVAYREKAKKVFEKALSYGIIRPNPARPTEYNVHIIYKDTQDEKARYDLAEFFSFIYNNLYASQKKRLTSLKLDGLMSADISEELLCTNGNPYDFYEYAEEKVVECGDAGRRVEYRDTENYYKVKTHYLRPMFKNAAARKPEEQAFEMFRRTMHLMPIVEKIVESYEKDVLNRIIARNDNAYRRIAHYLFASMRATGAIRQSDDGTKTWNFFKTNGNLAKITDNYSVIKSEYLNTLAPILGDDEHVSLGYVFETWYTNFFIPTLSKCSLKQLFKNSDVCGLYSEMGYNIEECASSPGHETHRDEVQAYYDELVKFESYLSEVIEPVGCADLSGVNSSVMSFYNKHKDFIEQMYRRCQDEINTIRATCSIQ